MSLPWANPLQLFRGLLILVNCVRTAGRLYGPSSHIQPSTAVAGCTAVYGEKCSTQQSDLSAGVFNDFFSVGERHRCRDTCAQVPEVYQVQQ